MIKKVLEKILCYPCVIYATILQIIHPIFIYDDEITRKLLRRGMSVSRFGDGELNIMLWKSGINFQKYDEKLAKRLLEIFVMNIEDYNSYDNFMIGLSGTTARWKGYSWKTIKFWGVWNTSKREKIYSLLKGKKCVDAFCSRCYSIHNKTKKNKCHQNFSSLKKIWKDRELLIVEGSETQLGIESDLLESAISIQRILIPDMNAYSYYNKIYETIMDESNKWKEKKLILIIAGPCATILAFDLYRAGFQAIDLGQVNDEHLGAIKDGYIKVESKMHKEEYQKQIIAKIK